MIERRTSLPRQSERCLLRALALLVATLSCAPEKDDFDAARALVFDKTVFEPFLVGQTFSLQAMLEQGIINADTPLLVMDHPAGRLAFLPQQMGYHHVAQGSIHEKPWMVSF